MTVKHMPNRGSFIAWKKVWLTSGQGENIRFLYPVILKIRIPARAGRVMGKHDNNERKCRAERAFVEGVYSCYTGREVKPRKGLGLRSHFAPQFAYEVGKMAKPHNGYAPSELVTCAQGIHFFMTKNSAMNYTFC